MIEAFGCAGGASVELYRVGTRGLVDDVQAYSQSNPNVLNVHRAMALFAGNGYSSADQASVDAFRKSGGDLVNAIFHAWLRDKRGSGDGRVVFMAGGNGAGKSTLSGAFTGADFVFDSTLSHMEVAEYSIRRVLRNGQTPCVVFIYREPSESWFKGVLPRSHAGGHAIPMGAFIRSHTAARDVLNHLDRVFGSKLPMAIFENSVEQGLRSMSLEELQAKPLISGQPAVVETPLSLQYSAEQRGNFRRDCAAAEEIIRCLPAEGSASAASILCARTAAAQRRLQSLDEAACDKLQQAYTQRLRREFVERWRRHPVNLAAVKRLELEGSAERRVGVLPLFQLALSSLMQRAQDPEAPEDVMEALFALADAVVSEERVECYFMSPLALTPEAILTLPLEQLAASVINDLIPWLPWPPEC